MENKLCMLCLEVYDRKMLEEDKCPKINCRGKTYSVHENMVPLVIKLSNKGYFVKQCSVGNLALAHDIYVGFFKGVALPNIPDGYVTNDDNTIFAKYSYIYTTKDYKRDWKSLSDWVDSLPPIEESKRKKYNRWEY